MSKTRRERYKPVAYQQDDILRLTPAKGIINRIDTVANDPDALEAAVNVEINNQGIAYIRDGFTQISSQSGIHSLFACPYGVFCVKNTYLCRISNIATTPSFTSLYNLGVSFPVKYSLLPDGRIAFTNGLIIKMITSDGISDFPFIDRLTVEKLDGSNSEIELVQHAIPPGNYLDFYNGCLLVLFEDEDGNSVLEYTNGWELDGIPANNFFRFPGKPSFLVSSGNTVWVGTSRNAYALVGSVLNAPDTVETKQYEGVGCIPDSAVLVNHVDLDNDFQRSGTVVVFNTDKGVCFGGDNGLFKQVSHNRGVVTGTGTASTAFMRKDRGFPRYVNIIKNFVQDVTAQ